MNTDNEMIVKHKIVSKIDAVIDLCDDYDEAKEFLKNFRKSVFDEIISHNLKMDSRITDKNYIISEYTYKRIKNRVNQYIASPAFSSLTQTAVSYTALLSKKYSFNSDCLSKYDERKEEEFIIDGLTYMTRHGVRSTSVYVYEAIDNTPWFHLETDDTHFSRCEKCPLRIECNKYEELKEEYYTNYKKYRSDAIDIANNMTFSDDVYIGHEYIYTNFTAKYNRFGGGIKGGEIARELFSTLKLQLEKEVLANKDFIDMANKFKEYENQLINKL